MQSNFPALLKVSAGRNGSLHTIAEFASIICTGPKRECRTPSAAEKLTRAEERLTRAMESNTWCSGKLVFTTSLPD